MSRALARSQGSEQVTPLKITYTAEAIADFVSAITYLNARNPTAAAKLDAEIARCIERLADREFEGQCRDFARVLSCDVGAVPDLLPAPSRRTLIVRVYHQARRPITR